MTCITGKVRYSTRKRALKARDRIHNKPAISHRYPFRIYQCRHCDG